MTLGETFITTLQTPDVILTQGFHQPEAEQGGGGCINPSLIDPEAVCGQIFDPVCGCDGITYPNSCVAQTTAGVVSWTPGECGGGGALGCTIPDACNYNPEATSDDGSCVFPGDFCDDNDLGTDNDVIGFDCVCAGEPNSQISGCMAMEACNYNAAATIDDGSCLFVGTTCDDGNPETQNDFVNADCLCLGDIVGCTALAACNYNSNATLGDFSCVFPGDPCDDGNANTFNDVYGFDCMCMGEEVFVPGCTEPNACNYNMSATTDDGSCLFVGEPCDDGDPSTMLDVITTDCICQGEIMDLFGCTVPEACNYNPDATTDDGSCLFPGDACDDDNPNTINDVYNTNCDCAGTPVSVDELQAAVSLYPNPATNEVFITIDGAAPAEVRVYDATGREVMSAQRTSRIDIHALATGVYTFRVMQDGRVWEQQIIKQ